VRFQPAEVRTFAGGTFTFENPRTVGQLREALRQMDLELDGWGDEMEISEVHVHNGKIDVTLAKGIPQ